MCVRCRRRFEDGKEHRYWSVVESCRRRDGRVVQRQVLHLGEINDGQRAAWCRAVEVVGEDSRSEPMALFAEDREAPELACETVRVKVGELSVRRPRHGARAGWRWSCGTGCGWIASGGRGCRRAARGRAGWACRRRWRRASWSIRAASGGCTGTGTDTAPCRICWAPRRRCRTTSAAATCQPLRGIAEP